MVVEVLNHVLFAEDPTLTPELQAGAFERLGAENGTWSNTTCSSPVSA